MCVAGLFSLFIISCRYLEIILSTDFIVIFNHCAKLFL